MGWLDDLLGNVFRFGGVDLVQRKTVSLGTGLYAVDNPTTASTDVTVVGGLTPTAELDASATVQPGSYAAFNVATSAVATLADGTAEGQRVTVVRMSDSTADVTFAGDINGTPPSLGSSGVDGITFYWEIPSEGPGRWIMESTLVTAPGGSGGLTVTTIAGTSYTTVLGDANTVIETSNASNVNITIPPNASVAYPIGTKLTIIRGGAGGVSLVAGSGVTLTVAFEVYASPPVIRAQYGVVELIKTATNTWRVYGDLTIFS